MCRITQIEEVIRTTKSCNLIRNNVALLVAALMLSVLLPTRAANLHVAQKRSNVYFLQHEICVGYICT